MSGAAQHAAIVKQIAQDLGFMACGISKADFLEEEAPRLEQWLTQNYHGEMGYMARNFDKRLDPRKLVPGSKSVVSLLFNYFPNSLPTDENAPKVARYAYGKDYHRVVKDKLFAFMHEIQTKIGAVEGRVFVDSAPVLEKAWAAKSGLGWVGKNTNLIRKQNGSYFLLRKSL